MNRRRRWRSLIATRGGQHAEAVVAGRVGVDEVLGPAHRLVACPPAPHRRGELALAAGPAEEHHQPAGHGLGDLDAVVVLDERQRHVDAGGDAGRRPHVAVADPDRVGVDVDGRVLAGEALGPRPVRRRPPAVEQAGGGEQEGAAAHADDPARTGRASVGDGIDERGVVDGGARHPLPPGTRRVSTSATSSSARGHELQPALGAHRPGGDRGDGDVVAGVAGAGRAEHAVGAGEDLVRPGDVERLHAVEGDDHDSAGGGACVDVWAVRTAWRQGHGSPRVPAIGVQTSRPLPVPCPPWTYGSA